MFSELKKSCLSMWWFGGCFVFCCFVFLLMGAIVLGREIFSFQIEIFSFQTPEQKLQLSKCSWNVRQAVFSYKRDMRCTDWSHPNRQCILLNTFEGWPFPVCPSRMPFCSSSNYTCLRERGGKKRQNKWPITGFWLIAWIQGSLL